MESMDTMTQHPDLSALKAFAAQDPTFFEPAPTMSLAEANLLASPTSQSCISEPASTPSPAPEDKKPAKKRKSWGQELPVPKTNLPPR